MIDLDLVKLLHAAADEYEAVIKRNRQLDRDIIELKKKYNEDITKIRANPSPKIHTASVLVDPSKLNLKNANKKYPDEMMIASLPYLSNRVLNALTKLKVLRVVDFSRLTLARLKSVKNCGNVTRLEIENVARMCGYLLK